MHFLWSLKIVAPQNDIEALDMDHFILIIRLGIAVRGAA
jgi:hypothetical protein